MIGPYSLDGKPHTAKYYVRRRKMAMAWARSSRHVAVGYHRMEFGEQMRSWVRIARMLNHKALAARKAPGGMA